MYAKGLAHLVDISLGYDRYVKFKDNKVKKYSAAQVESKFIKARDYFEKAEKNGAKTCYSQQRNPAWSKCC